MIFQVQARARMSFPVAILGLATLLLANGASATAVGPTPSQLVRENSQSIVRTLDRRHAEFQSDPGALHGYIGGEFATLFDRTYAARLVLGRNGRDASDADLRAFADALAENLMARYSDSLLQVDPGLSVRILTETPLRDGTIVKVQSLIDRKVGTPVTVDYLFHRNAGHWQIFDVIVEGVSFVQTFRSEFDDEFHRKTLAQITADLRANRVRVNASTNKR